MTSATLSHTLERSIVIRAQREVVFRFFTDSARWAAWWGAGSTIDPRPGGRVFIRYPGGIEVSGEIVEIDEPERIVFTYGFVAGSPIPPGSSLVTIALERERAGTRVRLSHAFAEAQVRDEHVQGWRYQLSLFANAVADDAAASVPEIVDRWFAAWSEPDAAARNAALEHTVAADVSMRDRFSAIDGACGSPRAPRRRSPLHARHGHHPRRRRAAVPGRGDRRLDCERCRRPGTGPGHQRVHADARGDDRGGDGVLG